MVRNTHIHICTHIHIYHTHTHIHTYVHTTNAQYIIVKNICYPDKPIPLPQPDRKHKPIPVSEFGTHVTTLHENSNQGFKAEYDVS